MTRAYRSLVRQEAKRDTRTRILDAMVDVVTHQGVHAFSVQNVADAAGVAHRTVYRHFPSREDLLEGLDELIELRGREAGIKPEPAGLDDLPGLVEPAFRAFDALKDAMRAYVVVSIALGRSVPSFERRSRAVRTHIARAFPNLAPDEVEKAGGVIRLLFSTRSWFLLTTEQGLSTTAAAEAVSGAIEVLVADLSARAARRSRTKNTKNTNNTKKTKKNGARRS